MAKLHIPPRTEGEEGRSRLQDEVERRYGRAFEPMNDESARLLLNWFAYGKAIVRRDYFRRTTAEKNAMAADIAAFISSDEAMAAEVHDIMERRFARHADGDFSKSVQRTAPYQAVCDWCGPGDR